MEIEMYLDICNNREIIDRPNTTALGISETTVMLLT